MSDPAEIAVRLREQINEVKKMAYALQLLLPESRLRISDDAHCICEWMKDACEALSVSPAERGS